MAIVTKLTNAISYDCSTVNRAKLGIENQAVIINVQDIDLTTLTMSGSVITNLLLKAGTSGMTVSFIKQGSDVGSKAVVSDNGFNTFEHHFNGVVYGQSATDLNTIKMLSEGQFVVVYESKFKGTGLVDSYKVLGIENGLYLSAGEFASNKDDSTFQFTLSSYKGLGEKYSVQTYFNGTYSGSSTKFNANFA